MKQDEIVEILKSLLIYTNAYKVLSEGELRFKIAEQVSKIDEGRRKEIESNLGENLEERIFESITTHEKLSITSPDLHVKINYLGDVFYCPPSHTYMEAEIKDAFLRLIRMRVDFDKFESVVFDFLIDAGYKLEIKKGEGIIIAEKEGFKMLYVHLLPTINAAPDTLDEVEGEGIVLVVPTEKTPWAFANFIHCLEDYPIPDDVMILVVNVESGTVDPFIGDTTDDAINSRFDNPTRARKAVNIWRASTPGNRSFVGLS